MFHNHKQWIQVSGRVLGLEVLPGKSAPHPKLFVIELHPEDSAPVRAEIRVRPGSSEHGYGDLFYRTDKDIIGFLFNPSTGEARFDMADPRNCLSAHMAAGDAWTESMDDDQLNDGSGAPWLVPATCPACRKRVEQRRAAMENRPHCQSCLHPLPAFPLVPSRRRH